MRSMRLTRRRVTGGSISLAIALSALTSCGDTSTLQSSGSATSSTPEVGSGVPASHQVSPSSEASAVTAQTVPDVGSQFEPAAIDGDKAFWRAFSMRADWIFATRSFTEMLKYADVVVLATVVKATKVEPLALHGVGGALTYVDLHLKVVAGLAPVGVSDFVLRIEAPGSLTPDANSIYQDWFSEHSGGLPVNPTLFVLKQRPDAAADVFQILNEWSIWIEGGIGSGVTTAFAEEVLSSDSTSYLQVASSAATLDGLLNALLDPELLSQLEA